MSDISQSFPARHREFWGDQAARQLALIDILAQWDAADVSLPTQLIHVDNAITVVLETLKLPRGPIAGLRLVESINGGKARKTRECVLEFSAADMRVFVHQLHQPDDVVRSWIHESIHARQPFSSNSDDEYRAWPGYEEGMVEGLTMIVVRATGLQPRDVPRTGYAAAYRLLAECIGISEERLVRALWRIRTGEVGSALPRIVGDLVRMAQGRDLTHHNQLLLTAVARLVFSADRVRSPIDDEEVRATWHRALQ